MRNWKKILYSVGMGVVACLIVIAIGLLVWQVTAGQRRAMAQTYLDRSEVLLAEKNDEALWELTKAYLLDLSYREYRIRRAKLFFELDDSRSSAELKEVIDTGWGDDEIFFDYAQLMLASGKEKEAIEYFKKVTEKADDRIKNQVLLSLVKLAGDQGKWEEAAGFRKQLIELDNDDPEKMRYEAAISLVTAELSEDLKAKLHKVLGDDFSQKKYETLLKVNGDSYVIWAADWLMDLGLPRWGRNYLQQLDQTSLEVIDVYLLQAKSYWLEGKCALAMDYVERAYQIDSTNEQVRKWEKIINKCES